MSADHDVPRTHRSAGAHDGDVHRSRVLLHRPLRGDGFRPDRKIHRRQVSHIADAGVDDQPDHSVGAADTASSSPNIPSVDSERRAYDEDVARLYQLHRGVDHQIVAGLTEHGDGAAAAARRG